MFSPPVAKAIAFVVAAAIFLGGMWLVATFVAAPFSHWIGEQTRGWPAWATLGSAVLGIVALYSLGFYLKRRDQRKADRATL
jgi:membrane protein implicated in regulation of membrane protease activity